MTTDAIPHAKVTAFMTKPAMTALELSSARLGISRTDVLNRAVQMHEAVSAAKPGDVLIFPNPDGSTITVGVER